MPELIIDGSTVNNSPNSFWRGFGFISANNSSRLLLDYRAEHREVYDRILTWLFDPEGGIRMSHLKLEMGADINSSSGTEPAAKRSPEEPADVTRGAGFRLAADAVKINPDLTLELLSWGVPGYIHNAPEEDRFPLPYAWFKETLDAAFETYGLRFSYIDPNINERAVEREWIKYFSAALKAEKDCPYPYGEIKIVAADEEAHFNLAIDMLDDPSLMEAVDVIGIHYISASDENTRRCKEDHGKELWYSEGLAPANISGLTVNADGSGLCGVNSTLDVAGRIVNMYPSGGYTMYEFQPAVAAYYSGVCYYPKQLIRANEPWSGHIEIGSGLYMAEHFGAFAKKGWRFVDSACFGDGREQDHVLYDTTDNRLTLTDPETGDHATVFVNNTAQPRDYHIRIRGLKKAAAPLHVWETRGPDKGQAYDANYFRHTDVIRPEPDGTGDYSLRLTVKPCSMVTLTTLDRAAEDYSFNVPAKPLALPYEDSFDYKETHGDTPRYTTDLGGAFETEDDPERGRVLRQKLTRRMKGSEWGYTPDPTTNFGDDCWGNYTVRADVRLEEGSPAENYAGIGLRYINAAAENSFSGYRLTISPDGHWRLHRITRLLEEGELPGFDPAAWHRLSLTADRDELSASIDGTELARLTLRGEVTFSGRAALFSAYHLNAFDALRIDPAGSTTHVTRIDDLDPRIEFSGPWEHRTMDSFTRHNRTSSGNRGRAAFTLGFEGDSLAVIGTAENAVISVELDGRILAEELTVNVTTSRSALWHTYDIAPGAHRLTLTVHSGSLRFDAIEFGTPG